MAMKVRQLKTLGLEEPKVRQLKTLGLDEPRARPGRETESDGL